MASKTIIDLPVLSTATSNTQNTVFVVWDKISGTTKQFTLAALDTAIGNASANAQSTGDGAFAKANSANTLAQNAYNQANIDYTTISTTARVYGNATIVPVITLAANGRVSSITNTSISFTANTLIYVGTAPSTNKGASGDTKGMVYLANNYFYYCSANYNGTTNVWSRIASSDAW